MKKNNSRSARWADACTKALAALDELAGQASTLEEALADLRSVQEEYEEWKDNLPENLASSALGEKLEEVCNLGIEDLASTITDAIDEARGTVEEAEAVELPRGFGRD